MSTQAQGALARALAAWGVEAVAIPRRVHIVRCPIGRPVYTVWSVPGHGLWVTGKVDSTRNTAAGRSRRSMAVAYPLERVAGHDAPFKCQCHPTRRIAVESPPYIG